MIENIDGNFARLLKAIDDKKLAENTVVVFLTDNGVGGIRWNAGLRNRKGTVYEGGTRVPCYVRWPDEIAGAGGRAVAVPLAHIDITPTVLKACGVKTPDGLDGRDFLPLLKPGKVDWPDRTLFFQWHRGDAPDKFRAFAARGPHYKLVQAAGVQPNMKWDPKFELFDVIADPFEMKDLAAEQPEVVAQLKREYEAWFADVTRKGFDPPRIVIGSEKENPVRLTRQDMRGPKAGWAADAEGHWVVRIDRPGRYEVTVRGNKPFDQFGAEVKYDKQTIGLGGQQLGGGAADSTTKAMSWTTTLPVGDATITSTLMVDGKERGAADYLELKYLGAPAKK